MSHTKFRANSLDAMRGLTIAMMVLCGTIVNWVLPYWNSHCQVPPDRGFDPSIYGITWVDLVFPFFLFAMGAAMPFAVGSRLEHGGRRLSVGVQAIWRGIKLAFFAIFIQNCYPWVVAASLGRESDPFVWCITLTAFLVLFLLFSRFPGQHSALFRLSIPVTGVVIACGLMAWLQSHVQLSDEFLTTNPSKLAIFDKHVDNVLYNSNIIILLLGDMATFGTIIYICTIGRPIARLTILPFLMAILLCKDAPDSWQQAVYNWSPFPWLYRFEFLKYLFVVIPGTIAGDFLRKWIMDRKEDPNKIMMNRRAVSTGLVAILALAIIVVNVTLLYGRHMTENLFISAVMASLTIYFAHRMPADRKILSHLVKAGALALMLGLFFEAFQGGIRKDDPTFSYYFVTTGLAFYCLALLVIVCDMYRWKNITAPFVLAGKNPMIAYVAPTMFIYPVMNLCGIGESLMPFWASTWYWGFARGVLFTAIAIALAAVFSRIKLYWRT
ncbi:MAG: DUF5009 domain-containing protein [Clostridiales bacterium]|nr:DUF5009 domain-containing protein [Clostridiales bacterium]